MKRFAENGKRKKLPRTAECGEKRSKKHHPLGPPAARTIFFTAWKPLVTLIKHHLDSVGYFFEDINFQSLMKRLFSPILLAAGLTLLQLALTPPGGQNTLHAENSKIILRHADMIEGGEDAVGPYRAAIGNVEMLKGELTMTCRRTTDYDGQNRIIMNGDVSISDGSMEVFGDDGSSTPTVKCLS